MKKKTSASLDSDACTLIFPVSAGMVGVCLTAISLVRVVITMNKVETVADDLLSFDAFLFLVANLTSYIALRTRSVRRLHRFEKVADISFMLGMGLMLLGCLFITYS